MITLTPKEAAALRDKVARKAIFELGHRQSPLITGEDVSVLPSSSPHLRPWIHRGREVGDPSGRATAVIYEGRQTIVVRRKERERTGWRS